MGKEKIRKKGLWWKIIVVIVAVFFALYLLVTALNAIGTTKNLKYAKSVEKVEYAAGEQVSPTLGDDGYYTFVTDGDFKIMQFTDLHLGGGIMSVTEDGLALHAVEKMIRDEKPNLVVITGDVTFPVPYVSGTNNNKRATKLFIEFMEKLGVYWTFTFGNHDQEIYSTLNADSIAEIYESVPHPEDGGYCLFQRGKADVDGNGNTMIKVKNTSGTTTQVLTLIDSHSYTKDDPIGVKWLYENIHDNQIDWYETEIKRITAENKALDETCGTVKSLGFWHIPLAEYLDAYNAYLDNGKAAVGDNYTYYYGTAWETGKIVFSGEKEDDVFERMYALGSMQGIFCGHDHDNNFSIAYDPNPTDELPAIRLTYGYSIDYLAYSGIDQRGYQRGCTVIMTKPDGSFDCTQKNLYTDYGYDDMGRANLTPPTT